MNFDNALREIIYQNKNKQLVDEFMGKTWINDIISEIKSLIAKHVSREEMRIPEFYKGKFISNSNSKFVEGWNKCLDAVLKKLVF